MSSVRAVGSARTLPEAARATARSQPCLLLTGRRRVGAERSEEVSATVLEHLRPLTACLRPEARSHPSLTTHFALDHSVERPSTSGCATDPGKVLADVEPAVDHRPHRRQAAAAIGDLVSDCRRERAPVEVWASSTAQSRPGAQLGEGAMLVSGGVASASVRGVNAAMWGDGSRVSLTSPPSCTPSDACPLFAHRGRWQPREVHFWYVHSFPKMLSHALRLL